MSINPIIIALISLALIWTADFLVKKRRRTAERVLDLNEPIEIELPVRHGCGRYIPTKRMITQHLQGAIRSLCDAKAALLVNDLFLADVQLNRAQTSLQAALRGKELRDAETTALAETQKALQAVKK